MSYKNTVGLRDLIRKIHQRITEKIILLIILPLQLLYDVHLNIIYFILSK